MSGTPQREVYSHLGSAIDRFKAEARSRLVWSIGVATALHLLAFFGMPTWRGQMRIIESEPWQGIVDWIVLTFPTFPDDPADAGGPELASPGVLDEADLAAQAGSGNGTEGSAAEIVGVSEVLLEALLARSLVPTLAHPDVTQGSREEPAGSGSMRVEGGAPSITLEGLAAADSLALELLNALRPELVALNPTTWILIRNPSAVEAFMRQRASDLPDLNGSRASASVALWIDDSGSVEWAEISQSSGHTDLDEVALQLFSEVAAFRPARDHGARVPTTAVFTIHFPW